MKNFFKPIFGGSEKPAGVQAYREILGIPESQHPPTLYQLLDISAVETDAEVIRQAASDRIETLRSSEADSKLVEQVVAQIESAQEILIDPEKRAQYDNTLKPADAEIITADLTESARNTEHQTTPPMAAAGSHLLEELSKENESLQARLSEWRRLSVDYQRQLETKEIEISSLKHQLDQLSASEKKHTESLLSQQEVAKHDLQTKAQELADKESEFQSLSERHQKLQDELEAAQNALGESEQKNQELVDKVKALGSKAKNHKEKIKTLQEQLEQATQEKNSAAQSSQETSATIDSLNQQIESLHKQLTDREDSFATEKQKLLLENAELKKQLAATQRDLTAERQRLTSLTSSSEPAAPSSTGQQLSQTDSLSEVGGQSLNIGASAAPERKPAITHPIAPAIAPGAADSHLDSRGTNSSLIALSNDPAEQGLDGSSLCTPDNGTAKSRSLKFRVRDRLNGSVVLEQDVSDGDCIRIGRIAEFCTFDVLARQLASDRVLSGRHFQLTFIDNCVKVQDVGSTNGTLAAGELLKKKEKLVNFESFVDNFLKIRAGELFQFELELVESEVVVQPPPAQQIQATMVTEAASLDASAPAEPLTGTTNDPQQGKGFDKEGFIADSEVTPDISEQGNSQDSLGWGD